MKKQILFIINNLQCGGAEKSLISLLETFDYSLYDVDLFLLKHEGVFMSKIPNQVNLLDEPDDYKYFDMSMKAVIKDCIFNRKFNVIWSRIWVGFIFKTEKNRARCDQRVWPYISRTLSSIDKKYDAAIGYLEKNPIYFCADKVRAEKRIGFVHNDYDKLGMDPELDLKYFQKMNQIITVSDGCENVLLKRFPMMKSKIKMIHNIVSPKMINNMSNDKVIYQQGVVNIVSIGRLNHQKGFDLAIKACKKLVVNGYRIRWYILGEGEERSRLEKMILDNDLNEIFILMGIKENPYPYIKQADIYLQPSRFEGKSIAIDEAKILKKPIVVTNFSTVKDQITHNKNGLIAEMNSESLFTEIKRMIDNEKLRKQLILYLSQESLGTESEIKKLYTLINEEKAVNQPLSL